MIRCKLVVIQVDGDVSQLNHFVSASSSLGARASWVSNRSFCDGHHIGRSHTPAYRLDHGSYDRMSRV